VKLSDLQTYGKEENRRNRLFLRKSKSIDLQFPGTNLHAILFEKKLSGDIVEEIA